jgi:hypothetical protein
LEAREFRVATAWAVIDENGGAVAVYRIGVHMRVSWMSCTWPYRPTAVVCISSGPSYRYEFSFYRYHYHVAKDIIQILT